MKFDSYHPTINLIYFMAAFVMVIAFRHPAYLHHIPKDLDTFGRL